MKLLCCWSEMGKYLQFLMVQPMHGKSLAQCLHPSSSERFISISQIGLESEEEKGAAGKYGGPVRETWGEIR